MKKGERKKIETAYGNLTERQWKAVIIEKLSTIQYILNQIDEAIRGKAKESKK